MVPRRSAAAALAPIRAVAPARSLVQISAVTSQPAAECTAVREKTVNVDRQGSHLTVVGSGERAAIGPTVAIKHDNALVIWLRSLFGK